MRMREKLSRALLKALCRHTPGFVKSFEIQILLNLTARCYGVQGRQVWHLSAENALKRYADFTLSCMTSFPADSRKLYQEAFRLGSRIRSLTGLQKQEDTERLVFYLYRNIRITMTGRLPGQVSVSECFFAQFYTPQQCAVMSAVDSGIIAGLCGGGSLTFRERITEGFTRCSACFDGKG